MYPEVEELVQIGVDCMPEQRQGGCMPEQGGQPVCRWWCCMARGRVDHMLEQRRRSCMPGQRQATGVRVVWSH